MKVVSLKTGQEIYGVIYKNNPSQIQEILNEPKLLDWHYTNKEAREYMEPCLVAFNLCYFQKSDISDNEYSYLFNEVPEGLFIVGIFQEFYDKNYIYILHDTNNKPVVLDENTLNNKVKNMTAKDFVENFLLIG